MKEPQSIPGVRCHNTVYIGNNMQISSANKHE